MGNTDRSDEFSLRLVWDNVWRESNIDRIPHSTLISAIQSVLSLPDARVLEVGCGSAIDSIAIARREGRAFALDYSMHGLQCAKRYIIDQRVSVPLVAGDTFDLPFKDNTFDLVFSQGLLEHFKDPLRALSEQIRVIHPGGFLCVDVPQRWSLATLNKYWHIRRNTWFAGRETSFSLNQLELLLHQNGLKVVSSYGWMYFPSLMFGVRNLHTLDERHKVLLWISEKNKGRIEAVWRWLENQRWYYRWLACIGVIASKPAG
jgi:ubiquinone/menaquinone biosynthesis C-methylase UbiE